MLESYHSLRKIRCVERRKRDKYKRECSKDRSLYTNTAEHILRQVLKVTERVRLVRYADKGKKKRKSKKSMRRVWEWMEENGFVFATEKIKIVLLESQGNLQSLEIRTQLCRPPEV